MTLSSYEEPYPILQLPFLNIQFFAKNEREKRAEPYLQFVTSGRYEHFLQKKMRMKIFRLSFIDIF